MHEGRAQLANYYFHKLGGGRFKYYFRILGVRRWVVLAGTLHFHILGVGRWGVEPLWGASSPERNLPHMLRQASWRFLKYFLKYGFGELDVAKPT